MLSQYRLASLLSSVETPPALLFTKNATCVAVPDPVTVPVLPPGLAVCITLPDESTDKLNAAVPVNPELPYWFSCNWPSVFIVAWVVWPEFVLEIEKNWKVPLVLVAVPLAKNLEFPPE